MRALGGVAVQMQLSVFDHRGGVLADLRVEHWAEFAAGPRRDRLAFSGRPSVSLIYGRSGSAVFAEKHGMVMPWFEKDAAAELEVFGRLLRFPWGFNDKDFIVSPSENLTINGVGSLGLQNKASDHFDVICNPRNMTPELLKMTLAGGGGTVTVKFAEYVVVGGVSIPRRRTILGPTGKKVLEARMFAIDKGQRLPASLFKPRK